MSAIALAILSLLFRNIANTCGSSGYLYEAVIWSYITFLAVAAALICILLGV